MSVLSLWPSLHETWQAAGRFRVGERANANVQACADVIPTKGRGNDQYGKSNGELALSSEYLSRRHGEHSEEKR